MRPSFSRLHRRPLYALDPKTVHTVHLNNDQIFIDSPDFSDAMTYTGLFRPDPRHQGRSTFQEPDLLRFARSPEVQHLWLRGKLHAECDRKQELLRIRVHGGQMAAGADRQRLLVPAFGCHRGRGADALPGDRSPRYIRWRAAERPLCQRVQHQRAMGLQLLPDRAATATSGLFALGSLTLFNRLTVLRRRPLRPLHAGLQGTG